MNIVKYFTLIIFFISIIISQENNFDKSIKDTEKQIDELKNFIKQGNEEVKELQSQSAKTKKIIQITNKNIKNSESLIRAYNTKINLYNKQLKNLEEAVIRNNEKIDEIKESYKKRSISLYKNKDLKFSNYIFNSNSFSQMIYRLKYFNIISEINKESVQKIKTTQNFNKKKTGEITSLLKNVGESKKNRAKEINNLRDKKNFQEKLLNDIKKEEKDIKNEINKKIQQVNALEKLRKKIIEDKKKFNEQQLASLKSITRDIRQYKGKLNWPVDGKIVKSFGPQWNPKLNTTLDNPGIDISARSTLPVKSVFDGYVSTITFILGYGTTVIIDHNNNYFTVFTHLENLLISEDTLVREGQNIGYVSNENIIHFEIWGNNQKLDPQKWLKNGY
tara:strand:- start:1049 stop:2218 length:1170 start_codon:yes stop_codon:yes gene_type:complete